MRVISLNASSSSSVLSFAMVGGPSAGMVGDGAGLVDGRRLRLGGYARLRCDVCFGAASVSAERPPESCREPSVLGTALLGLLGASASTVRAACDSGAWNSAAACDSDAFMAPASLASSTSRDSRSASFLISSADSGLAVEDTALDDEQRVGLGEVTQTLRRLDRVTGDEGDRRRTAEAGRRASSIPASLAAILVSVFFTTAYVAFSPSERRSSLSCATVRPRYSVSTAAFELRNCSASSATAAALSALAMGLLSG